jgi:hypothetical protein
MATIKDKAKKAIADITTLLFGEQQKFMDVKTSDGTALKIDGEEIKEGVAVTDAEGNAVADGDYTLDSGTVISCVGGMITKVVEAATTTDTGEEAMKSAAGKFATGTPEERIANLETVVKALMEYCFGWQMQEANNKKAIEVYQTSIAAQKEEMGGIKESIKNTQEAFKQILPVIEELANEPVTKSTETSRTNFSSTKQGEDNRIQKIADAIQNFKKNKN